MLESGNIDDAKLKEIESIDNCFSVIDYRIYLPIEEGKIPQQEAKLQPLYKQENELKENGADKKLLCFFSIVFLTA